MFLTCATHDDGLHETEKVKKGFPEKKPNAVLYYKLAKK